jgi:hypothetical protein
MLYDMQLGGFLSYLCYAIVNRKKQSMLNQRKPKFIKKKTLVTSKRSPTEIRTNHENKMSIYTLKIYIFLH